MSTRPAVDRLVMYKHGVAYVSRSGPVDGDLELTFRRDDMKDVLKSLTVDIAGGQASVGTIAFDTPSDPRTELAGRNLLLEPGGALLGLIEALRGRVVEVRCGDRRHRGEVVGVDESGENRRLLVLRTEAGAVSLVDLNETDQVDLIEDPSRADLAYLIDRSRAATAGQDCQVAVQIRGAAEQARVSYIVPAPMWRVSYRLVRDGDTLVLAAMGIVHNPVDEDLTDVSLTLTTGQPISFDIDLYHGRKVRRAVVEEPERVAVAKATRAGGVMPAPALAGMPMAAGSFDAYADAAADVETSDSGEHFEYRLTTPVSLKRGGAAMVPLAVTPVDGVRRELVWRDGAPPAPDVVLAFTNSTGVVLEEGPAVIYEQDSYAGEAMVPFTARDTKVRLAFAKDLAVRCRSKSAADRVTVRVRLGADAVVEEQRFEKRYTLRAENDHDEAVDVIFELLRVRERTFAPLDGVVDIETDGGWHRVRISVPGHQTVEATVLETWPVYTEIDYRQLSPRQLEQWLAGRSLDAATIDELSGVLRQWEHADRLDAERDRLEAGRIEDYAAQTRIAEQLKVLGSDGQEGELRRRQVDQLEQLQNRVNALDTQIRSLRADADAARVAASEELRRLIGAG
ncbi:hypothetical protein [Mycobacterium aquaticum]|uniref:DUF4139 domain-containing protein n=1 Tax=Mycobacterium aquaticum TaxID=1927124 RepID=A0A1X0AZW5_9MYCO|nr:hypothetical protein [Mycobacterium aquaticum]ORA35624.1 hypothetical protein BST13_13815 [Mycobacterium aquaticum]